MPNLVNDHEIFGEQVLYYDVQPTHFSKKHFFICHSCRLKVKKYWSSVYDI